jgi:hypothetical protein
MSHKTVPLFRVLVVRSVSLVRHELKAIVEVKDFRNSINEVERVALEAVVALENLTFLRLSVEFGWEKDLNN